MRLTFGRNTVLSLIAVLVMALGAVPPAQAAEEGEPLDPMEHVVDGIYMDFSPFGKWELPRLFVMKTAEGGWTFQAYATTKSALKSGNFDLHVHGDDHDEVIEGANQAAITEAIAAKEHLHADLEARQGRIVLDMSVTRYLVFVLVAMLITLLVFIPLANKYKRGIGRDEAPRGIFQNMFEAVVVYIRDDIAKPNIGEQYPKFLPYLLTVFFLILFGNIMGIIPYGEAATANLGVTAVLAIFTLVIGHVYASAAHWKEIFTGPSGVPALIRAIMVPIEIAGTITRHAALAIRLFANMVSGGLMIIIMIGLIFTMDRLFGLAAGWGSAPVAVLLTVGIMVLKFLVAFIQAYVFTLLSALFIGMEVHEHEHEEHEDEATGHGELTPAFSGDGTASERSRVDELEPATAG